MDHAYKMHALTFRPIDQCIIAYIHELSLQQTSTWKLLEHSNDWSSCGETRDRELRIYRRRTTSLVILSLFILYRSLRKNKMNCLNPSVRINTRILIGVTSIVVISHVLHNDRTNQSTDNLVIYYTLFLQDLLHELLHRHSPACPLITMPLSVHLPVYHLANQLYSTKTWTE